MATSDLAQYLQAKKLQEAFGKTIPAHWAVWDHEDTSRWGNQLNREAFVKLVKDPMKAMG